VIGFGDEGEWGHVGTGWRNNIVVAQGLGVPLRDDRRRAQGESDAVVFGHLPGHAAKGVVRTKVRDDPLQGTGVAATSDVR